MSLGNSADPTRTQSADFGPFSDVIQFGYWAETRSPSHIVDRFYFSTDSGLQSYVHTTFDGLHAVAVHDGDIGRAIQPLSTIPEPASLGLVGLGLWIAGGLRRAANARPRAD